MDEKQENLNVITTEKFSGLKWTMIEKPLSDLERKSNEILYNLGQSIDNNAKNEVSTVKTKLTTILHFYKRHL